MAYDEVFAARVRAALAARAESREIKMFGRLCWMVGGHMAVGCGDDDLMVYVGSDGVEEALESGARPAMMGERTMGGVVLVRAANFPDADSLVGWADPAVKRARAKPPKK